MMAFEPGLSSVGFSLRGFSPRSLNKCGLFTPIEIKSSLHGSLVSKIKNAQGNAYAYLRAFRLNLLLRGGDNMLDSEAKVLLNRFKRR